MSQPQVEWHADTRALLQQLLGEEAFSAAARALAVPPTTTCVRVNTLRADPTAAAAALRGVLGDSCGGSNGEGVVCAHPELPEALLVASGGVVDVDITPACGREVAVNRRCAEAVLRGADIFVPGVTAISSGVEENQLVAVTAVIHGLDAARVTFTRGTRLAPGECTASGRLLLGLGRTVLAPRTIFRAADGLAVTMVSRRYQQRITGEILARTLGLGTHMLQNLPSVVAAHALAPRPGSEVLDMCASPGGKTSVLCALMGNAGTIVALDVNPKKVEAIRSLCSEMGCTIVRAYQMDATKAVERPAAAAGDKATPASLPGDHGAAAGAAKIQRRRERKQAGALLRRTHVSGELTRGVAAGGPHCEGDAEPSYSVAPFPPESFDFILCDAPCTALGLKPRLSQPVTAKELVATASYQRALLHTAVALLRPGGALVFSTCTISPLENESKCAPSLACALMLLACDAPSLLPLPQCRLAAQRLPVHAPRATHAPSCRPWPDRSARRRRPAVAHRRPGGPGPALQARNGRHHRLLRRTIREAQCVSSLALALSSYSI